MDILLLSRPIKKLRTHLDQLHSQGQEEWCHLERAYRCISLDSVSEIAFGRSFGYLDKNDFGQSLHEGFADSLRTICVIRHFPFLVPIFNNLPLWVMRLAGEKLSAVRMIRIRSRSCEICTRKFSGDANRNESWAGITVDPDNFAGNC